jgi:stage II sporulation protein P
MLRLGGGITYASSHTLRLPQPPDSLLRKAGGISRENLPLVPRPTVPEPTQSPELPAFTAGDLTCVRMRYGSGCKYRPDLEELIRRPLSWNLDQDTPTVLILHSHGTEAYTPTPGQEYTGFGSYRTRDKAYNMVAVGESLAQALEAAGIRVIHDRTLHDDPSYNAAYPNARQALQQWLELYPDIQLVIDLHRDAATEIDGSQYATSAWVDGKEIAQLMLVMGTHSASLPHPNWEENLSVALKLLVQLERLAPGITRPTTLATSRYNQDLHPAMLLVEVGSAGNSLTQAKAAAQVLAEALIGLKLGANQKNG